MKDDLAKALKAFGATTPRFISQSENAVYEVDLHGKQAVLRLHRPGYQGPREIWSEMWWLDALDDAGVPVPAPHVAKDGTRLVTLPSGRLASMVSWVKGAPMGEKGSALAGSQADQVSVFHNIGQTLAHLHNVTDTLTLPSQFIRHAWDVDGLMGETPFWGPFWQNPTLTPQERALILLARDTARTRLDAFRGDGGDFGLIHADAIRSNVFVDGSNITLIDFDDAGFGFRLYDLAVLMTQNEGLKNTAELQAAAIRGYRSKRALPERAVSLIPLLVMARRLASMGWIVPRSEPGDPRRRQYAESALIAAERFLMA